VNKSDEMVEKRLIEYTKKYEQKKAELQMKLLG
jgi:hypothetical protein